MKGDQALIDNVRGYLHRNQWREQAPGVAGSLWQHNGKGEQLVTIAVPVSMRPGGIEWRSVVERLATFEQRPVEEMATRIRNLLTDVTRLRAANDLVISGSIPLSAGVGLVTSAHRMLRAIATTALRPRAHIAGNFSRLGDQMVDRARLGHTEEGSYILPILMPLTEERSDGPAHFWTEEGGEVTRVTPEPPERRVTRTLAQALTAVEARIVQPARDPRPSDMHDLIAAGVSRELVLAVGDVLDDSSVATFEARFDWATGVTPPAAVPDVVPVPAAATELLRRTARLLSTTKRDPRATFTGPIVEVRHLPGDPFGEVALQTTRNGRQVEIRVRLTERQLDHAHEWMRTSRTIVAEGPILRTPGRPLRVDAPTSFYPLDESYLSYVTDSASEHRPPAPEDRANDTPSE